MDEPVTMVTTEEAETADGAEGADADLRPLRDRARARRKRMGVPLRIQVVGDPQLEAAPVGTSGRPRSP